MIRKRSKNVRQWKEWEGDQDVKNTNNRHSQTEIPAHTKTHIHIHTHTHTHTLTHTIKHTYKHIYSHTDTQTHIHSHTRIHTNTHTHGHTHMDTHTDTDTKGFKVCDGQKTELRAGVTNRNRKSKARSSTDKKNDKP